MSFSSNNSTSLSRNLNVLSKFLDSGLAQKNTGIGALGNVVFKVSMNKTLTFSDFTRNSSVTFAEHAVSGSKPISEFTGKNLDEITFIIQLNACLNITPLVELRKLENMRDYGEPQTLTIGTHHLGKFTIRELVEEWEYIDNQGNPLIINITLTLKEYCSTSSNNGFFKQIDYQVKNTNTEAIEPQRLPGHKVSGNPRILEPVLDK